MLEGRATGKLPTALLRAEIPVMNNREKFFREFLLTVFSQTQSGTNLQSPSAI
jgi:hypothetical protein